MINIVIKKHGRPQIGELVVAEIVSVNPNSVVIRLKEYDMEGMIHVSEVSSGWVRDIRHFVRVGQEVVAKLMRSDRGLGLSLKRVSSSEKSNKMKHYRQEIRAEKMLGMVGQKFNKTQEEAWKEVGQKLYDEFGSLYEVFKLAMTKPQKLKESISDEWILAIADVAEKNIEQKEFELRAKFIIRSNAPDGIGKIKTTMKKIEKMKIGVHYIAAPEYLLKYGTKDPKKGTKDFMTKLEKIAAEEKDCEIKFELVEQ